MMYHYHLMVADALAGRAKTTSAQHYVLHDLKSFTDKYVKAWSDFAIDITGGKYHK